MNHHRSHGRARALMAGLIVIAAASVAIAADAPASAPSAAPSKEMREKMATMYEQMATCLRSDKSMADCRAEMMKSCPDMMGKSGCSTMMGPTMMGMGRGMMNMGHGMHDHTTAPAGSQNQP